MAENKTETTTTSIPTNIPTDLVSDWSQQDMLEITLPEPEVDSFRKTIETLTRIGFESKKEKKLIQSCHILKKQGKYFIVHFKELFNLDNKGSNLTVSDLQRRNTIAKMLEEWGLVQIVNEDALYDFGFASLKTIKIIPYKEKGDWILESKYTIGRTTRK